MAIIGLTKVIIMRDFEPRSIRQSHSHSFSLFPTWNLAANNYVTNDENL